MTERDDLGGAAGSASEEEGGIFERIADGAGDAVNEVMERAGDVGDFVRENVTGLGDQVRENAEDVLGRGDDAGGLDLDEIPVKPEIPDMPFGELDPFAEDSGFEPWEPGDDDVAVEGLEDMPNPFATGDEQPEFLDQGDDIVIEDLDDMPNPMATEEGQPEEEVLYEEGG